VYILITLQKKAKPMNLRIIPAMLALLVVGHSLQEARATVIVSGWTVIDNSFANDAQGTYTEAGTWNIDFFNAQWGTDHRYAATTPGVNTHTATWNFLGLTSGIYEVAVSYSWDHNRPNNAPYSINGGTTLGVDLFSVSQDVSTPPSGVPTLSDGGAVPFQTLTSTYALTGSSLAVVLGSNAAPGEFVIADAVAIRRAGDLPVAADPAPEPASVALWSLLCLAAVAYGAVRRWKR
jgi:hypothetical protein